MLLNTYIVYVVTLLPVVILISYVYKKDLYPEDKREVFIAFLFGAFDLWGTLKLGFN